MPPGSAPRSTARRAASGTTGTARRVCPAAAAAAARQKNANSSAPTSALPGRQLANTTSATQIQPRPLTMLKKKELKADSVRNAPGHAHQRRARPRWRRCALPPPTPLAFGGLRVLADHAHRQPDGVRYSSHAISGTSMQRQQGQRRLRVDRSPAARPSIGANGVTVVACSPLGKLTRYNRSSSAPSPAA